ncbi:hypothetical protein EA772_00110 [Pedobacter sp. G11]|nr:hypothetical protein EA772_00110 [Pedobacter sp. G11]
MNLNLISKVMLKKIVGVVFAMMMSFQIFAQLNTQVLIRAQAKDAKFIGTGIGGALVVVRDHLTKEILAKGLTTGSSGNTEVIMNQAKKRGQSITDSATAKFIANLKIAEPTFVDIEVLAPVNRKNATINASTQLWVIPGKNILGEGIVLEIPGFIVDILSPTTHQQIKQASLKNGSLNFKASVTMSCGCPITSGGIWNADKIKVQAIVKKEGVKTEDLALVFTGQTNLFEGKLNIKEKGNYEILVFAYDEKTGNTGVDKINFVIQ